jgi:small redox-active disulfide protein 2
MVTIEVLGPGCAKCAQLATNAQQAVDETGIEARVSKVTDINAITSFGVMLTPAIAIDGEVKASGKVPGVEAIKGWLQ